MLNRRIILIRISPLLIGVLSLGGCGGGVTSAGSPGGPQTANVGPAVVSFNGQPHPLLATSSGQVSVLSQAGASYTGFTVDPTPNLASTYLAFTRLIGAGAIYTMPYGGTPSVLVNTSDNGFASCSNTGVIAFASGVNETDAIETIRPDGSGAKVVLASEPGIPTISPNGTTIIYVDATSTNLFSVPASGGTPKKIYSGSVELSAVVWSPNGSQIAFAATNKSTGNLDVYTMPATGGTLTDVTPPTSAIASGNYIPTSWSPDSTTLACEYTATGGSTSSVVTVSLTGGYSGVLTPTGLSDLTPSFSPDNKEIAFYRTGIGGVTSGIYVEDFEGANPQLILPDPPGTGTTGTVYRVVWSPFQQPQTFVGTGGTLTTAAASGFLLAETGSQFASLLTFAATTPSTATISAPASVSGAPLIYMLAANAITNISFANVYYGTHTSLPLTSTPTAIVSIDGATGLVNLVAPATVMKSDAGASRGASSTVSYTGQFPAVYDGTGKNLAPSGATTIQIDRTTGKLIAFR